VLAVHVYIIFSVSLIPVSRASSNQKADDSSLFILNNSTQNMTNSSFFSSSSVVSLNAQETESKLLRNLILSFICIPIIVSTLIGNMLVILAVVIVRKLHQQDNANNFLIVSLALSDFLVGVLVMPFAFYVEISEENK